MRIALTGNPNSGKTTMYNALTGQNEKVGNWAGVTVDKNEHPIKKSLRGNREQMLAVYRYEKLAYAQKEISEIFTREKIPHVLLKGAVIRCFYPHPWHRSSCDVDILVHEEDLSRACAALCDRAGYRVEGKKKFHDIHLYSQGGVHLELHFNLLSTYERCDAVLSRVWDFANENANNCYLLKRFKQKNHPCKYYDVQGLKMNYLLFGKLAAEISFHS
jgi:hypothetical protein